MAYSQVAGIAPQYEDQAGYYLKFYEPATTTPIAMATDSSGGTTLAKAQLDSLGFVATDGSARFVPFVDQDYDCYLFPTANEADSNDTSSAIRIAKNYIVRVRSAIHLTLSELLSRPNVILKQKYVISDRGSNLFDIVETSTVTPNGYNIVQLTESPSLSAVLRVKDGLVSLEGCGVSGSEDSGAFAAAMTYASENELTGFGGDNVSVAISGFTRLELDYISMKGGFSVVGSGTEDLFLPKEYVNIDNVKFSSLNSVLLNSYSDVKPVNVNKLNVSNCEFNDIVNIIEFTTDGTSDISEYLSKNISLINNTVIGCSCGFRVELPITGYDVTGNEFYSMTNTGRPAPIDNEVHCISMGRDTETDEEEYQDQGAGNIAGNSVDGLVSTLGGVTNFIRAFGQSITISKNPGKNMTATGSNTEGIYVKGHGIVIDGNPLLDMGGDEAVIKLKGTGPSKTFTPPAGRILNEDNIVSFNIIEWVNTSGTRKGINTIAGNISIIGNRIKGANADAIGAAQSTDDGENTNSVMALNVITGLTCGGSGQASAFNLQGAKNVDVNHNIVEFDGSDEGRLYGLRVDTHDDFEGGNVSLSFNNFSMKASTDTGGGSENIRCVNLSFAKDEKILDFTIVHNKFKVSTNSKNVVCVQVSGTTSLPESLVIVDNENLVKSTSGSITDLNLSSSSYPTEFLRVENNTNFDFNTNFASQSDLLDNSSAVNNIYPKYRGKRQTNSNSNEQIFAAGSSNTSVWVEADGTTRFTPI